MRHPIERGASEPASEAIPDKTAPRKGHFAALHGAAAVQIQLLESLQLIQRGICLLTVAHVFLRGLGQVLKARGRRRILIFSVRLSELLLLRGRDYEGDCLFALVHDLDCLLPADFRKFLLGLHRCVLPAQEFDVPGRQGALGLEHLQHLEKEVRIHRVPGCFRAILTSFHRRRHRACLRKRGRQRELYHILALSQCCAQEMVQRLLAPYYLRMMAVLRGVGEHVGGPGWEAEAFGAAM